MSRNLCQIECDRCGAEEVFILEQPRYPTAKDCGRYLDQFREFTFADAECGCCQARYLAWVDAPDDRRWGDPMADFFDLSYRSTFNDEPGPDDLPKPTILIEADAYIRSLPEPPDAVVNMRQALADRLNWPCPWSYFEKQALRGEGEG